jgi:putative colanic acid biosynthesis glycosyltransferase
MKTKVLLQINVTANWGSTGKIAEQIGQCAIAHGWESYIAYGRWYNPSQSHLIKIGDKLNMYQHYAEQRIFDNEGLCSRRATKEFIKRIDEIKPNVIQLHNIHDHYLNYRLLFEYLNKTDIKVVWTFHDCWAFTGHCFHFITKGCERWKSGCFDCPLQHEYPKTLFDRSRKNYTMKKNLFGANNNLTIIACSEWIANFVRQSFLKDKPIYVINNGIDLNVFKGSESLGTNKKSFHVLAVSNVWNKDKGFDDILKLREILSNEYEITIVGVAKQQLNSLPQGIVGIERTQNVHELVALYSKADVFINPTYADNFPTVNLEALACGTPVITYRTGGSPEALDENTGVVVEQGDINGLAVAIQKMKENPLSSADCRKRAEDYFERDKCYDMYIDLYDSLLK